MGNFIKIGTTLTNPNITKLTRDSIIDDSTVLLLDMSRKATHPAQVDLSNGNTLYNLVNNGQHASVVTGTKMPFSPGGKFVRKDTDSESSRIKLPETCKLKATDNSFMFTLWFTNMQMTDLAGSQAMAGYASNSSNQMAYAFYWFDGQYFLGNAGNRHAIETPAPDTLHQLTVACDRSLGVRKYYHNGVLVRSETNQIIDAFGVPVEGSDPWLFYLGGGFNNRRNMKFHRAWLDINSRGENFDTKVVRDWNENRTVFR